MLLPINSADDAKFCTPALKFIYNGGIQLQREGKVVLTILLTIALVAGGFAYYFLEKYWIKQQPALNNSISTSGANSPAIQANNSSNPAINFNTGNANFSNSGLANYMPGTNNQFQYQNFSGTFPGQLNFPAASVGTVNVNYPIYTTGPNSELLGFITQINLTATYASNGVTLTSAQILRLTQLLKILDERTSAIHLLPDGRTSLGGLVVGASTTLGNDFNKAIEYYNKKDYKEALTQVQKAILEIESDPTNNIQEFVNIAPGYIIECYHLAFNCSRITGNIDYAYKCALKLNTLESSTIDKAVLISSLSLMADKAHSEGKNAEAYEYLFAAITNFEGNSNLNTNYISIKQLYDLYMNAGTTAYINGNLIEATNYLSKAYTIQRDNNLPK